MKRQRGRGRSGKPGGGGHQYHNNNQPNRTMESSGPEGKVRGPAAVIFERYLQAARDAASSGDRILSENFMQHAEHYFRLLRQMQPAVQPQMQSERFEEFEGEDEGALDAEAAEEGAGEADSAPEAESEGERRQQAQEGGEREGEFRRGRGRGRRNRFRPEGERAEGESGEGESPQAAREEGGGERRERAPRAAREPREPRGEREENREGFGSGPGPRPAFLGSD